jgi:hypothetical protein
MKLGDFVKDTVTDFSGTVIARHEYLNGCIRLSLQPRELKDGKLIEATTFDIEQLELVKAAAPRKVTPTGGPHNEPSRAAVPAR